MLRPRPVRVGTTRTAFGLHSVHDGCAAARDRFQGVTLVQQISDRHLGRGVLDPPTLVLGFVVKQVGSE